MIAKAQVNDLINKVTKEAVKQCEKALVDNSGKLAKSAVNKIVSAIDTKKPTKNVIATTSGRRSEAMQMATDLINSLASGPRLKDIPSKSQPTNLNSLISLQVYFQALKFMILIVD